MHQLTISRLRGGYAVSWREDGRRRRYQLAARSRAAAEAEARDVYLRHTRREEGLTVADLWRTYREHLTDRPTGATMGHTGKAVLPHFGALRPDQITADDCHRYTRARLAEGRAIGTVHTEMGHLRSALNHAAKRGHITRAPHIDMPPKPDSDVRPLSAAELAALVDACAAPHVRLAVLLLATTAARVGAILDLTWDRVDLDRRTINLRLPDSVRRKGRAVVPMNATTIAALSAAYPVRTCDYVVEYAGGRVRSIRTGFAAAARRAGIDTTIHQIRHSAAVAMLGAGVPMELVGQMLGHSNLQTTRSIYGRYTPQHMQPAADALVLPMRREG